MNCLFLLVLIFCCGNNGRRNGCGCDRAAGASNDGCGCGRAAGASNDGCGCDRPAGASNDGCGCDRSDDSCSYVAPARPMPRYDEGMRGCGCQDTVPEMRRPYPVYPDSCGCGD